MSVPVNVGLVVDVVLLFSQREGVVQVFDCLVVPSRFDVRTAEASVDQDVRRGVG
jgi:hypothetical protein